MRSANIVAAIVTLALGVFMVFEAGRMHSGFGGGLNPGVFPRLLGSGLVVLSVIQLAAEFVPRFASIGGAGWPRGKDGVRVLLVGAALITYLVAMEYIGFTVATFLLVLFLVHLLGSFKWPVKLAAAVFSTALCTTVFQYWLDLKLPGGFLGM